MKNKIKNIINAFAIVWFLVPVFAFAGTSISFNPTSPQVYDGTSDIAIDCDADGNGAGTHLWVAFSPGGTHMGSSGQAFNACNSGTFVDYGGGGAGQYTNPFQQDAGSSGTVTFVYLSYAESGYNECVNGTDDLTACQGEPAYTIPGSHSVTYVLTGAPPPPPPPGGGGIDAAIANATSSFQQAYGFDMDGIAAWMWDNLGQPIAGSGIGTLLALRWQILGLIAISIIVFFAFAYFRFYKH